MFGNIFNNKSYDVNNYVIIKAPISGKIMDLSEVKDEVFASKMLGDGIAIDPSIGSLIAPFDGIIKQIFPTGHAVVLESKKGLTLLIHIGLDTVNLKGEGFEILAKEGQNIKTKDPIIKFDIDFIRNKQYYLQTPILLPEGNSIKSIEPTKEKYVNAGEDVLMKVSLNK